MPLPREVSADAEADTPDHLRADYSFNISRRDSLASSRFSSRLSRRSSVRDEVQSVDEFLRKQRVIRYMQEERERAERSKLLREEHDFWIEFRDRERVERLKYMSEQEIAELLQREADEATRESSGADQAHQRAMEDALRRRHSMADLRRMEEDAVLARLKSEVLTDEIRRAAQLEALEKAEAMAATEHARRVSVHLQQREEDLAAKCKQLTAELEEAKAAATQARCYQKRAEDELAREREKMLKEKAAAAAGKEMNEKLLKELEEVRQHLTASEEEKKRVEAAKAQAVWDVAQKEKELSSLRRCNDELVAQQASQKAVSEDEKQRSSPLQEELTASRNELKKERAARSNTEAELVALREQAKVLETKLAAAIAPEPKQEADTIRKLKAIADDARRAQADLLKERQVREKAEAAAAEAKGALAKEQAAREKAEEEVQRAVAASTVTALQMENAVSDRKKLVEAEKKLEKMRKERNKDEAEKAALKRGLQKVKRDLEDESAARAQFEQLASKALSADHHVSQREVDQLRRELKISQEQCDAARQDTVVCQQNAVNEIASLRAWCERLQKQHRMQLQLLEDDDEFTPRMATPTPHSRSPSSAPRRMPKKGLAAGQRQADERVASDQRIHELEAHVMRLQADLQKNKEQEKKALKASAEGSSSDSQKTSPHQILSGATTEQEVREMALVDRVNALEREGAETRRKYDDLVVAYRRSEAARCEAERQVAAQQVQAEQLQKQESQPHTPTLANCETTRVEPIVGAAEGNTSSLPERISNLEGHLMEERATHEPAEKRGVAPRVGAELAVKQAGASSSASVSDARAPPQKTKSGCC
ncbi:hypothetical protein NXY56_005576 [Leishmania guyanensis]|uniref:200 kDa antigen p200 n=1 Tax=Leishmania guyanensis TaxID=5670 RepID=A0A1E1J3A9_LEIGU|nr:hypothetical protein, conserved [Leishmania guyanensis]